MQGDIPYSDHLKKILPKTPFLADAIWCNLTEVLINALAQALFLMISYYFHCLAISFRIHFSP